MRTGSSASASSLAELQHRLARQDDFLALVAAVDLETGPRQTVAVGGDRLQRSVVDDEQHAVEVVADVLLRHRELGRLDEAAQVALRQRQLLHLVLPDADPRIVGRGERLQVEARAAGAHRHLVVAGVDVQRRIVRQRPQQVLQLARRHGHRLGLLAREFGVRGDLHFEVGGGHVEAAVAVLEQHIGENWQRMSAFDDARHGLQRFQQRIAGYLLKLHCLNRITANRRRTVSGMDRESEALSAGWRQADPVDNNDRGGGSIGGFFAARRKVRLIHKL